MVPQVPLEGRIRAVELLLGDVLAALERGPVTPTEPPLAFNRPLTARRSLTEKG